ncbi:MAG: YncE family protein [bacterium]
MHSVGPHNSLRDYLRGRSRSALFGLLALCVSATSAACSRSPTGDSDGSRLLVVSAASDEILVLDAETGDPAGSVSVDARPGEIDEPHGIAVDSARGLWYVTLAHGEPTLWKFDVRDDRLVGRLRLGSRGAARIGLTPDGTRAFIPSYWRGDSTPGTATAVRLQDLTVVAQPSLCPAPHDARVSPDGELVLVTCALGDEVLLLGAGTLEIRNRVAVGGEGSEATDSTPTSARPPRATPERASAPARPMNAAWAPDGESAWVTLQGANEVIGLDRDGGLAPFLRLGPP